MDNDEEIRKNVLKNRKKGERSARISGIKNLQRALQWEITDRAKERNIDLNNPISIQRLAPFLSNDKILREGETPNDFVNYFLQDWKHTSKDIPSIMQLASVGGLDILEQRAPKQLDKLGVDVDRFGGDYASLLYKGQKMGYKTFIDELLKDLPKKIKEQALKPSFDINPALDKYRELAKNIARYRKYKDTTYPRVRYKPLKLEAPLKPEDGEEDEPLIKENTNKSFTISQRMLDKNQWNTKKEERELYKKEFELEKEQQKDKLEKNRISFKDQKDRETYILKYDLKEKYDNRKQAYEKRRQVEKEKWEEEKKEDKDRFYARRIQDKIRFEDIKQQHRLEIQEIREQQRQNALKYKKDKQEAKERLKAAQQLQKETEKRNKMLKGIVSGGLMKTLQHGFRAFAMSYDAQLVGDGGYWKAMLRGALSPYTTYAKVAQERQKLAENKEDFALTGTDNNFGWNSLVGATAWDSPDELKRKTDIYIRHMGINAKGAQALYRRLYLGENAKAQNTTTPEKLAQIVYGALQMGLGGLGIFGAYKALKALKNLKFGGAEGKGGKWWDKFKKGAGKVKDVAKDVVKNPKEVVRNVARVGSMAPHPLVNVPSRLVAGGLTLYDLTSNLYQKYNKNNMLEKDKNAEKYKKDRWTKDENVDASGKAKHRTRKEQVDNGKLEIKIDAPFNEFRNLIRRTTDEMLREYQLSR